ncbi:MAG TPA: methylamine utilization protein, partial [Giesbergeria sp.]|nr:methylamine utilization protein [Giesbergeria sp.]
MPLPAPRKAAALCALLWLTGAASAASLRVQVLDSAGKPLEGAVVSLVSDAARRAVRPLPEQEIAQENKQFVPAVRVVTVGTLVRFPNRDSVRHHVYSFSPAKKFEIKLYAGTPAAPVRFDQPGVAVLGCNIHDQMV